MGFPCLQHKPFSVYFCLLMVSHRGVRWCDKVFPCHLSFCDLLCWIESFSFRVSSSANEGSDFYHRGSCKGPRSNCRKQLAQDLEKTVALVSEIHMLGFPKLKFLYSVCPFMTSFSLETFYSHYMIRVGGT